MNNIAISCPLSSGYLPSVVNSHLPPARLTLGTAYSGTGGGLVGGSFRLTNPHWQEVPLRLDKSSISHTVDSDTSNGGHCQAVQVWKDLTPSQWEEVRQYEEESGCGVGFVVNRFKSGEVSGAAYSRAKRTKIPSRVARLVSNEFSPAARKKIRRVFDCNPETFKTFISFTFDAKLPHVQLNELGRVDQRWAKSEWKRFINALTELYHRKAIKKGDSSEELIYLWVVEIQPGTGNPHFHIVTNKPFIAADKLRKTWGQGPSSVDIDRIKDSRGAGSYLRKYIQKGGCSIHGNRYNMSACLHDTIKPLRIDHYGRSLRNRVLITLADMKKEIELNGGRVSDWGFNIPAPRRMTRYKTKQGHYKVTRPITTGQISLRFLVAITQLLDSDNPQTINILTNELEYLPF